MRHSVQFAQKWEYFSQKKTFSSRGSDCYKKELFSLKVHLCTMYLYLCGSASHAKNEIFTKKNKISKKMKFNPKIHPSHLCQFALLRSTLRKGHRDLYE